MTIVEIGYDILLINDRYKLLKYMKKKDGISHPWGWIFNLTIKYNEADLFKKKII